MMCPDPAATAAAGVRLITIDRPGYGRSDPVADPTLVGFAHDLERLLDHLWLGQVRMVGWSCGGHYVAACAAVLAERVGDVALVATPAPDSELRWLTPSFREVARLANEDPRRALAAAAALGAPLAAAPERAGEGAFSPLDISTDDQHAAQETLTAMWMEAFSTGPEGLAADVVAVSRPWDFSTSEVRSRAALFYGDRDRLIDQSHCEWWARALTGAQVSVRRGRGYPSPIVAWSDILEALAPTPKRPGRR
jgi:pimeloyl-ACP methyl ester carboxylesterase